MKRLAQIMLVMLLAVSCNAQNVDNKKADSKIKPKTNIIVNKEYDKNGNLVRYDSTYSYFYSNVKNDSTLADSSFTDFQKYFYKSFPDFQSPFFNDMFFQDSLLTYDFYKKDFFSKRFELNKKMFNEMFEKMDSLKNKFYNDITPPKDNKKK